MGILVESGQGWKSLRFISLHSTDSGGGYPTSRCLFYKEQIKRYIKSYYDSIKYSSLYHRVQDGLLRLRAAFCSSQNTPHPATVFSE